MNESRITHQIESAVGSKVRVLRGSYQGYLCTIIEDPEQMPDGRWHYRLARVSQQGEYMPDEAFEATAQPADNLWPCWMDETMISVYRNAMDNVGQVCTLSAFLLGQRHREQIMQLRAMHDEHEQKEAKKYLPTATISGVFHPKRKADCLQRHSGLLCIDIDPSPANTQRWGPQLLGIAELLQSIPYIAYYAHSCRGVGYYALIRITVSNAEEHKALFQIIEREFAQMGVELDKACKDVSRNRFLSWDDRPFWRLETITIGQTPSVANGDSSPVMGSEWTPSDAALQAQLSNQGLPIKGEMPAGQRGSSRLSEPEWALRKIELCVEEAEYRHLDVTGRYDECLMLGRSLYALGSHGYELWCRLCALRSAAHTQMRTKRELAVKWMSFRTDTNMRQMTFTENDPRMQAFFSIMKYYGVSYKDAIERERQQRRQRYGR